jgi:hypothetical protein
MAPLEAALDGRRYQKDLFKMTINDKIILDMIILYVVDITTMENSAERFDHPLGSSPWPGIYRRRPSVHTSDVEGEDMATTTLSTQTITEMVNKLGGLSLSPSELEGLAPQLETLFRDIQILESIDLGEAEPETLFDIQGE